MQRKQEDEHKKVISFIAGNYGVKCKFSTFCKILWKGFESRTGYQTSQYAKHLHAGFKHLLQIWGRCFFCGT